MGSTLLPIHFSGTQSPKLQSRNIFTVYDCWILLLDPDRRTLALATILWLDITYQIWRQFRFTYAKRRRPGDWEFGLVIHVMRLARCSKTAARNQFQEISYNARSCPNPINSLVARILPSQLVVESDNILSLYGHAHLKKQHNHIVLI
jgi:hypothetical protein